jgi:hypothetical protein
MYAERSECSVAEGFAQTETKESKWSLQPEDLKPHMEVSERAQSGLQGISDPLPDDDDAL